MTRSCADAAEALTLASLNSPHARGVADFWRARRAWDLPSDLDGAGLIAWRDGFASAHDEALALRETRSHIKTWINALYETSGVLRRVSRDAPPKSPSLRLAITSSLTRASTALAYVPPEMQILGEGA